MSLIGSTVRSDRRDEIALRDSRVALTWGVLDAVVDNALCGLLTLDLGPARRVAVFAENAAETVVAYLATMLAGVSGVPVSNRLRAEELAYILRDSGAAVVLAGPESVDVACEGAAIAGGVSVVAWRSETHRDVIGWNDLLARGMPGAPPAGLNVRPFLHYTSGTTGLPKGAETPRQIQPRDLSVAEFLDHLSSTATSEPRPQLLVSPLYHGLGLASVRGLAGGDPLVVMTRFDPEQALQAVELHQIATIRMVPTHFVRLLGLPDNVRRRYDVSSLRLIAHSAAPCPIDVKRRMIDWLGPILVEAYGATEMGSATRITAEEWLERPGSVGRALPEFEVLVVSEDGDELPANQVGRIYFSDRTGEGIVFHNDPEKTRSVHLRDGVFTMGDLGWVDEDGYVYLTGRDADTVISGGVNIYPAEAERVLIELPGVADAVCIGVPNADLGEELRAFVIPSDPHALPDTTALIKGCQARLAKYKCPRSVEIVPDFGRTETDKVDRRKLRAEFARQAVIGS